MIPINRCVERASVMSAFNKRTMERFELQLPTRLSATGEPGLEPVELVTTDICAGGAFFHTEQPLAVGTEVEIEMILSLMELKKIKGNKALIRVKGTVVRDDEHGMAVCFDHKHQIAPLPEQQGANSPGR